MAIQVFGPIFTKNRGGGDLAHREVGKVLTLQISNMNQTPFLIGKGHMNHPLCSIMSNSIPPCIDFYKKTFYSPIYYRKRAKRQDIHITKECYNRGEGIGQN